MNFPCNPSSRNLVSIEINRTIGTSGGVSLTLGLHQNNGGVAIPEPFPMRTTLRVGLYLTNEGFVMGGFGRYVIGGQHLHDFVG